MTVVPTTDPGAATSASGPDLPAVVDGVQPLPTAAGLALVAADTGRVLMLQRSLIDGGPSGGRWEFPGGGIEPDEDPLEGAVREFCEETGQWPPDDLVIVGTWMSANGIYQGFVGLTQVESAFACNAPPIVPNPDAPAPDPAVQGSNTTEAMAWFDVSHLSGGPKLLRQEVTTTPWRLLKNATPNSSEPPAGAGGTSMAAGGEIRVRVVPELDGDVGDMFEYMVEEMVAAGGQQAPNTVKLSTGWAFPIPDVNFLKKAIKAVGRAKPGDRAKVKAHIISRAKALGASDLIPKEWSSVTASAEEAFESLVASLAASTSALLPESPLSGPTPFTVNDDGTADGHLALWASCHIGYPGCVRPPREDSFDFFNLGDAVTADGQHVPVGKLTVGTGHAGADLSWRTAAAHYDNSGTAAAVSHAVPDKWGIRIPSVLLSDVTGQQVDELRRSPLSGDWRKVNGRLRLVAALGVNVPGYAVPRALVASGEVQSMFVGFVLEDAAALVAEADSLAASIGLDVSGRTASLRSSLGLLA